MAAAAAPRPSTAPRQTLGDLTVANPNVSSTGAQFEAAFNPPPPPQPFTFLGLSVTQWVVVGAVGITVFYFRKEIWNYMGKKLGLN